MKLLIFTDNHFCETYSLIQGKGQKYTLRLENQIESLNWLEKLAIEKKCDAVICAGDFFDKPALTETEITALKDIEWNTLPHYFLVGNHESSANDLSVSTTKVLETKNHFVVSEPTVWKYANDENEIWFLPYIIESDRKPLFNYFGKGLGRKIIISHNDIKGIQLGPIMSSIGFEIKEFEESADLVINGHLHNGQKISEKVINLGDLTGKDFGEDALKYAHNIMILDTETLEYELIENPYAFNFYKLEINKEADLAIFKKLKQNAVLSIKCNTKLLQQTRDIINESTNILGSRIIITRDLDLAATEIDMSSFSVDHIAKFIECVREHYGSDPILEEELAEVCK